MTFDRFRRILLLSVALYFIGSALVVQAQDADLPFTPTLMAGGTSLVNDDVVADADLVWNLTLNQVRMTG